MFKKTAIAAIAALTIAAASASPAQALSKKGAFFLGLGALLPSVSLLPMPMADIMAIRPRLSWWPSLPPFSAALRPPVRLAHLPLGALHVPPRVLIESCSDLNEDAAGDFRRCFCLGVGLFYIAHASSLWLRSAGAGTARARRPVGLAVSTFRLRREYIRSAELNRWTGTTGLGLDRPAQRSAAEGCLRERDKLNPSDDASEVQHGQRPRTKCALAERSQAACVSEINLKCL